MGVTENINNFRQTLWQFCGYVKNEVLNRYVYFKFEAHKKEYDVVNGTKMIIITLLSNS